MSDVRELALRAIADTSRYDAVTVERDFDASCALAALEAAGLRIVPAVVLEKAALLARHRKLAMSQRPRLRAEAEQWEAAFVAASRAEEGCWPS